MLHNSVQSSHPHKRSKHNEEVRTIGKSDLICLYSSYPRHFSTIRKRIIPF